ncbi:hypothetical protein Gotur_031625 [Gossypium turneri]
MYYAFLMMRQWCSFLLLRLGDRARYRCYNMFLIQPGIRQWYGELMFARRLLAKSASKFDEQCTPKDVSTGTLSAYTLCPSLKEFSHRLFFLSSLCSEPKFLETKFMFMYVANQLDHLLARTKDKQNLFKFSANRTKWWEKFNDEKYDSKYLDKVFNKNPSLCKSAAPNQTTAKFLQAKLAASAMLAQAKTKKEYKKRMVKMLNSMDSGSRDNKSLTSTIKIVDLAVDTTSVTITRTRKIKNDDNFLAKTKDE